MATLESATPLRILVTDAHELAALGAVRSLGRAGHRVTVACPRRFLQPASAWSRHCAGLVVSPDPWRSHREFCGWLEKVLASGDYDAVLPVAEGSTQALASLRPAAPPGVMLLLPPDPSLVFSLSKFHATRKAESLGFLCPPTVYVEAGLAPGELEPQLQTLRTPAVVKLDNALTASGAYRKGHTAVRPSLEAVLGRLRELEAFPGTRIVQQMIPGRGVGAFFLRWGGRIVAEFAHRRLHEVPYTGGMSSLRESCHDEPLLAAGRRLLEALDYEGVAMVEFRLGEDGRLYFMEINGRLWGSLALALHCGVDFPRLLLDCQRGLAPAAAPGAYPDGLRCRNLYPGEVGHVTSVLKARAANGAKAPSKVGALAKFAALTLDPRVRHDHLWPSDPGPALKQALELARFAARKTKRALLAPLRRAREAKFESALRARHEAALAGLNPPPRQILFVCYGNICRSPFAELYWNALRARDAAAGLPEAASSGFYFETNRSTPAWIQDVVARFGVDMCAHRSRMTTRPDVGDADAIFVMDRQNERDLLAAFPEARGKAYYLGLFAAGGPAQIADPFLMEEFEAEESYCQLAAALDGLAAFLDRRRRD